MSLLIKDVVNILGILYPRHIVPSFSDRQLRKLNPVVGQFVINRIKQLGDSQADEKLAN